MVGCCIFGCKTRSERKADETTFHSFPCGSNQYLMKKWIDATGRKNWFPSKYTRICSIHFTDDSYYGHGSGQKHKKSFLKKYAIPTLHVHTSVTSEQDIDPLDIPEQAEYLDDSDTTSVPEVKDEESTLCEAFTGAWNGAEDGIPQIKEEELNVKQVPPTPRHRTVPPLAVDHAYGPIPNKKQLQKEKKRSLVIARKNLTIKALRAQNKRLTKKLEQFANVICNLNDQLNSTQSRKSTY